jgi:hypothetical protein
LKPTDKVFPEALQLDSRPIGIFTYDFCEALIAHAPGGSDIRSDVAKLFSVLQVNSRTPPDSIHTPRWYLRGNQWLVGFNVQLYKDHQINRRHFDDNEYNSVYSRLLLQVLFPIRNSLENSERHELGRFKMSFFWREGFSPNCSIQNLANLSGPRGNEYAIRFLMCKYLQQPLATPDWAGYHNRYFHSPILPPPAASAEETPNAPTEVDVNAYLQPQYRTDDPPAVKKAREGGG